jgi:hypothetical protein
MDEDSGFVTEKLAACIYAALRFPENDPAVVAAWDENQLIITDLIQMSLNKYGKAIIEQTIALQPEEQARLQKTLEQERLRVQKERELAEKQKRWEVAGHRTQAGHACATPPCGPHKQLLADTRPNLQGGRGQLPYVRLLGIKGEYHDTQVTYVS